MSGFLQYVQRDGTWFRFPTLILRIVPSLESGLVLAYLMNHSIRYKKKDGDWFFCTHERMARDLKISQKVQRRLISQLEEAGFLRTELKGVPPIRHIRVEWDKLEKSFEQLLKECGGFDGLSREQENDL